MLPIQSERSLDLKNLAKYNRTLNFLIISTLKLISQKQKFVNRIEKNSLQIGKISIKP